MSNEKRLWIIEARDGAWGANGICKGELVRCGECIHAKDENFISAIWCENLEKYLAYDFFCADGKRKEKDDAKGET